MIPGTRHVTHDTYDTYPLVCASVVTLAPFRAALCRNTYFDLIPKLLVHETGLRSYKGVSFIFQAPTEGSRRKKEKRKFVESTAPF